MVLDPEAVHSPGIPAGLLFPLRPGAHRPVLRLFCRLHPGDPFYLSYADEEIHTGLAGFLYWIRCRGGIEEDWQVLYSTVIIRAILSFIFSLLLVR
jgi:hypothetical protein